MEKPLAAPSHPFPCSFAHWVFLNLRLGQIWDRCYIFLSYLYTAWLVNPVFIFRSLNSATVQACEYWFPTKYLSIIKSATRDMEKSNVLKSRETKCKILSILLELKEDPYMLHHDVALIITPLEQKNGTRLAGPDHGLQIYQQ